MWFEVHGRGSTPLKTLHYSLIMSTTEVDRRHLQSTYARRTSRHMWWNEFFFGIFTVITLLKTTAAVTCRKSSQHTPRVRSSRIITKIYHAHTRYLPSKTASALPWLSPPTICWGLLVACTWQSIHAQPLSIYTVLLYIIVYMNMNWNFATG